MVVKISEVMRFGRRLTTLSWVSQNDTISTTYTEIPPSAARCARVRLTATPVASVEFSEHYVLSGRDLLMMTLLTLRSVHTLGRAAKHHIVTRSFMTDT